MKCPTCRNECPDGAEFCPVCYEVLAKKPSPMIQDRPAAPAASQGMSPLLKGAIVAAAAVVAYLAASSRYKPLPGPASQLEGQMPSLSLPTRGSSAPVALDRCPTDKCLTVYVAPWCPHCRAAGPLVKAVREDLAKKGVTTRIIVGMDAPQAVESYADDFGPDTLLDSGTEFKLASGVPSIFVSDAHGGILHKSAGLPEIAAPSDPAELRQIESEFFGL